MKKSSFASQKNILEDACLSLRSFTLGARGISRRAGATRIDQVNVLCDRVAKLFASGPFALQAARVVASARTRVAAALARLALLNKKP